MNLQDNLLAMERKLWSGGLDIEVEGFLQPTDDVALLTYHASAVRGKDEPYEARVSRGYVRRGGDWKMMFHQQTPLSSGKEGP